MTRRSEEDGITSHDCCCRQQTGKERSFWLSGCLVALYQAVLDSILVDCKEDASCKESPTKNVCHEERRLHRRGDRAQALKVLGTYNLTSINLMYLHSRRLSWPGLRQRSGYPKTPLKNEMGWDSWSKQRSALRFPRGFSAVDL